MKVLHPGLSMSLSRDKGKLHDQQPRNPVVPTTVAQCPFSAHPPSSVGDSARATEGGEKSLSLLCRWVHPVCECKLEMDGSFSTVPSEAALKDNGEAKCSQWVELRTVHLVIHFVQKEK